MPVSWFRPQVVVGDGNKVYVGGGVTEDEHMFTILKYNPDSDRWTHHSPSQVVLYGLSYFQGKLITVGGSNMDGFATTVSSYDRVDERWEEKIPPMPTARCTATVICTDTAVIVCGGAVLDESPNPVPCRLVEVYNSETRQWHTSAQLPHPYAATSFTVINGYCFLVGEAAEAEGGQEITYAKTKDLIETEEDEKRRNSSSSLSTSSLQLWKELSPSPLLGSAATTFRGALLTLGGDDRVRETLNQVHAFVPKNNTWIHLPNGVLPEARGGSSAAHLSDDRVVMVGGSCPNDENSATVFIGTILYD